MRIACAAKFDDVFPSVKSALDFELFDEPILKKLGGLLIKENTGVELSAVIDHFDDHQEKELVSEVKEIPMQQVAIEEPEVIVADDLRDVAKLITEKATKVYEETQPDAMNKIQGEK